MKTRSVGGVAAVAFSVVLGLSVLHWSGSGSTLGGVVGGQGGPPLTTSQVNSFTESDFVERLFGDIVGDGRGYYYDDTGVGDFEAGDTPECASYVDLMVGSAEWRSRPGYDILQLATSVSPGSYKEAAIRCGSAPGGWMLGDDPITRQGEGWRVGPDIHGWVIFVYRNVWLRLDLTDDNVNVTDDDDVEELFNDFAAAIDAAATRAP